MKMLWKAVVVSGALALSSAVFAEEAAPAEPTPAEATSTEAPADGAAAAPVVQLSVTGDQVVKVNSGNEAVDAVANLAAKCAERSGAFRACDSMGGFKAMGCRKMAEYRYKDLQCPL